MNPNEQPKQDVFNCKEFNEMLACEVPFEWGRMISRLKDLTNRVNLAAKANQEMVVKINEQNKKIEELEKEKG